MALPEVPKLSLAELDKQHADTVRMLLCFLGQPLTAVLCRRVACNLAAAMDDERVPFRYIEQSLLQYENRVLDAAWCDVLARQLVARGDDLQCGVVQLYDHPVRREWVPMEIFRVEPCEWQGKSEGQSLLLYCLAGHPAGHRLQKRVPERFLNFLAYQIGYSRRLKFDQEPRDLVGLRLWGYLVPGQRDDLEFMSWDVNAEMLKWNKTIIRKRSRFSVELWKLTDKRAEKYSCQYDEEHYCHECTRDIRQCVAVPNRERVWTTTLPG